MNWKINYSEKAFNDLKAIYEYIAFELCVPNTASEQVNRMKSDIHYKTFIFEKRQFENVLKLEGRMAKEISQFILGNQDFFQSFESVILYYDNGQHELNRILNTVLAMELSQYDVRKVLPKDYKLFQAADLICTLQLLSLKCDCHELSRSEQLIFHNERELKKQFLKPIRKKKFL